MQIKNLSTGNNLLLDTENIPNYTDITKDADETTPRQRTQTIEPFASYTDLLINDKIELFDNINNVSLCIFTIIKKYRFNGKNYYKTNEVITLPDASNDINTNIIINSFNFDGENETWECTLKNNIIRSFDNIISKNNITNNNNSLSYNFTDGVINISRNIS